MLGLAALELTDTWLAQKYRPPAAPAPPAYKEVGDGKPAQPNDQNLGGNWWTVSAGPSHLALQPIRLLSKRDGRTQGDSNACRRTALVRPSLAALRTTLCCRSTFHIKSTPGNKVRKTVEFYREQAQASAADLAMVNLHADLAVDYFQARSLDSGSP